MLFARPAMPKAGLAGRVSSQDSQGRTNLRGGVVLVSQSHGRAHNHGSVLDGPLGEDAFDIAVLVEFVVAGRAAVVDVLPALISSTALAQSPGPTTSPGALVTSRTAFRIACRSVDPAFSMARATIIAAS
jgi:hypothetical protein